MAAKAGARGKVIDYWKFSSFGIVETKEGGGIVGQLPKDAGREPGIDSSFPVE